MNQNRDPFRPVDMRWRRAIFLAARKQRTSRKCDDAWIVRALHFAQALQHCRTESDHERLARWMPALFAAHQIYSANALTRWELEARLLAAEPIKAIAQKCQLQPEVIECYGPLFFEVSDCLDCSDYIVNLVLGPRSHHGLSAHDPDVLIRLYGYAGGSSVLDVLIEFLTRPQPIPEQFDLLDPASLKQVRTLILCKAAVIARTMPTDVKIAANLLRVAEALRDLEPRSVDPTRATGLVLPLLDLTVDWLQTLGVHQPSAQSRDLEVVGAAMPDAAEHPDPAIVAALTGERLARIAKDELSLPGSRPHGARSRVTVSQSQREAVPV